MFEHRAEPLLSPALFIRRMLRGVSLVIGLIVLSLLIGMAGYHRLEHLNWVDSFYNAALIMSGMGPANIMQTNGGKIFASLYSIYSGLFLIAAMGLLLVPIFHRMLHSFHRDTP